MMIYFYVCERAVRSKYFRLGPLGEKCISVLILQCIVLSLTVKSFLLQKLPREPIMTGKHDASFNKMPIRGLRELIFIRSFYMTCVA